MSVFTAKVSNLFDLSGKEIADRIKAYNKSSNTSEINSWETSVPKLIEVLKKANLGNLYLVAEYKLPADDRIDAVLLGDNNNYEHIAVIVELKQWSRDGIKYSENLEFSALEVYFKGVVYHPRHPVKQTDYYVNTLIRNHENFINGKLKAVSCQYLHNFEIEDKSFFIQKDFSNVNISNLFVRGEEDKFVNFLKLIFSQNVSGETAKNLFLNGNYTITDVDMEAFNYITKSPENLTLLNDQDRIMDYILSLLEKQARGDLKKKCMIIVNGAAGTGKTILGFYILAKYYEIHKKLGEKSYKCRYCFPRNRTIKQVLNGLVDKSCEIQPYFLENISSKNDLLVIDEAHRIEKIPKSMNDSQIVVVLQDDKQRILGTEKGTLEEFKNFAKANHFFYKWFRLEYQKRSGFGSYVDRIDNLLYKENNPYSHEFEMEILISDNLCELENWIINHHNQTTSVKYYAPYCWKWVSMDKNNPNIIDINIRDNNYEFKKQWNPWGEQYDWYLDSIDRVGCIYTAQGLGFDYIGLIWWDDLVWRTDHWEFHIDKVTKNDKLLRNSIIGVTNTDYLLLNIYRVLLTRAKKGIGIWFKDKETKQHFKDVCLR